MTKSVHWLRELASKSGLRSAICSVPLGKLLSLGLIFLIGLVTIVIAVSPKNCFKNGVRSCLQCAQPSVWHMANRKSMSVWVMPSCLPLGILHSVLDRARCPLQQRNDWIRVSDILTENSQKIHRAVFGSLLPTLSCSLSLLPVLHVSWIPFSPVNWPQPPSHDPASRSEARLSLFQHSGGAADDFSGWISSLSGTRSSNKGRDLDAKDLLHFNAWLLTHVYAKGQ